jgi:hypothetical protein
VTVISPHSAAMSRMVRDGAPWASSEPTAHSAGPAVVNASVMPPWVSGQSSSD